MLYCHFYILCKLILWSNILFNERHQNQKPITAEELGRWYSERVYLSTTDTILIY